MFTGSGHKTSFFVALINSKQKTRELISGFILFIFRRDKFHEMFRISALFNIEPVDFVRI